MNDSTCPRPCLMKLDLQSSTNKLAFLKDNWPSFGQIESIDRLSSYHTSVLMILLILQPRCLIGYGLSVLFFDVYFNFF